MCIVYVHCSTLQLLKRREKDVERVEGHNNCLEKTFKKKTEGVKIFGKRRRTKQLPIKDISHSIAAIRNQKVCSDLFVSGNQFKNVFDDIYKTINL